MDDLGNFKALTAVASLDVSRWAFSYDGGSSLNGIAVSPAGRLVVPNAATNSVVVIDPRGRFVSTLNASNPPLRNVAIGFRTIESVYVLSKTTANVTFGQAFDLASGSMIGIWASEGIREGVQAQGLVLQSTSSKDTPAFAYVNSGSIQAHWAVFSGGTFSVSGQTLQGPAVGSGSLVSVGRGSDMFTTDGASIFSFSGTQTSYDQLAVSSQTQLPSGPFTNVSHMIGYSNGLGGVGFGGGQYRVFFSSFPGTFSAMAAQSSQQFGLPVAGSGRIFFVSDAGVSSSLCSTGSAPGSFGCAAAGASPESVSGIALGAGDTLYSVVTRVGGTSLQVRTASTLALRYEVPLSTVVGRCDSLLPTCIGGAPVVGCVDASGKTVFVYSDARGIDTTADWPMEGHDPAKTFNTSTDLSVFACP